MNVLCDPEVTYPLSIRTDNRNQTLRISVLSVGQINSCLMSPFGSKCYTRMSSTLWIITLQWRHNGHDCVSNHQPHDCLLNCLFGRKSMKTPNLCVTGLCVENSPVTGEFPAQMASYAKKCFHLMTSSWKLAAQDVWPFDPLDFLDLGCDRCSHVYYPLNCIKSVSGSTTCSCLIRLYLSYYP